MTNIGLGIKPEELCDQHLVSCHSEIHQEIGLIQSNYINAVQGHIRYGQFDLLQAQRQHQALHREARQRGMSWDSSLPDFSISDSVLCVDAGLVTYPFPYEKVNRVRMASKTCGCLR